MNHSIGYIRLAWIAILLVSAPGAFAQKALSDWAVSVGGKGWDVVNDIACDASGNVYVTGSIADSAASRNAHSPARDPFSCFLSKYDTAGKLVWTRQILNEDRGFGSRLAITADNTLMVAGGVVTENRSKAGSEKTMGYFLSCLDTMGNIQWRQDLAGTRLDLISALTTDPHTGDVVITGRFRDTLQTAGLTLVSQGKSDALVLRYSKEGAFRHAATASGKGNDVYGVAGFDATGTLFVAGALRHEFSPDENTTLTPGHPDETGLAVVLYDASGKVTAASLLASGRNIRLAAMATGDSCFYLTGSFREKARFQTQELASAGSDDIFVACLDHNLSLRWVKQAGGPGKDRPAGIVATADELILCGSFTSPMQAGPVRITSGQNNPDVFILGMELSGGISWYKTTGGEADDYPRGLVSYGPEYLYLTGSYRRELSIGSVSLRSAGEEDVFIARIVNCNTEKPALTNPVTKCEEKEILLDAGEGFLSYDWNHGQDDQRTFAVTEAGACSLELVSASGCRLFDTITVTEQAPPSVFLGNDTTLADTGFLVLDAGGPYASYKWSLSKSSRKVIIRGFDLQEGVNRIGVEVLTADSCTGYGEIEITVVKTAKEEESALLANRCTLYPNPTDGRVTLVLSSPVEALYCRICSPLGAELCSRQIPSCQAFTPVVFDLGGYPPGIYTLTVSAGNGFIVKKIILQ